MGPLIPALAEAPQEAPDEPDANLTLNAAAAELPLTHLGRRTDGRAIEKGLAPSVRAALNDWSAVADDLDLTVVVPASAHALVLGRADEPALVGAAEAMDRTWELFAELGADADRPAVVAFLFDAEGFASNSWSGVLRALVSRRLLHARDASRLEHEPGGVRLHQAPIFLQPTYDMAGDAAAGDDEFRLDNEVAHKLTDTLIRTRFGSVPECMRWGLGYVAEQRLFRSIYQFNRSGFVSVQEHADWPKRTREALKRLKKQKGFRLAESFVEDGAAGRAVAPQMIAWGTLDYLLHKKPDELGALLAELADLHAQGAGGKVVTSYAGDLDGTREVLGRHLDGLKLRTLDKHLKRVK